MGESFGAYSFGQDEILMQYISSCNIACGFHAGDPSTIEQTIALAIQHQVAIGAHPSYPDLAGFGRRYMDISPNELKSIVKYQVAAVQGMAASQKKKLIHVKPHGALYNAAAKDETLAKAIIQAVAEIDTKLLFVGPAGNRMAKIAADYGLRYVAEAFTDRRYQDDLQLVSRSESGAVIESTDEAVAQALLIAESQRVKTNSGAEKEILAQTLCIHGDKPGAAALAKILYQSLLKRGFTISSSYHE